MIEDGAEPWVTGQLALTLLAVDPAGLGGVHLRARAGSVRDAVLKGMAGSLAPLTRLTPGIDDAQLFGGVDIPATLSSGQVVRQSGLLATPRRLVLTMAERCGGGLAARLAQALDTEAGHSLVLLDEGAEPDERAPACLVERVAFSLDLDGIRMRDLTDLALEPGDIAAAQSLLPRVSVPDDALVALAVTAARFGITSLRAPLLALAAARAHAALMGRRVPDADDLQIAVQLVYVHRATQLPAEPDDEPEPEQTPPEPEEDAATPDSDTESMPVSDALLVEAVRAMLPPEVLLALTANAGGKAGKGSGGAGVKRKGNRRGRPLPSRPGKPGGTARIDIIATLRAAAPWQPLRRKAHLDATGLLIRPSDIHIRQYQDLSDRLVIFAVDASGSSAVARLAEAKGAIETMLAEAYARRDHVALIAFRGAGAEVVLPPTRSLVQTKRRLAALPGGGGTPLAAGLQAVAEIARRAQGHGLSPALALLTDGRANVPLPGRSGRAAAQEDAISMARVVRGLKIPSAVVDTAVRPQRDLPVIAAALGARYVPLPRADAARIANAVGQALET